jgi:hypothetical protein
VRVDRTILVKLTHSSIFLFLSVFAQNLGKVSKFYAKKQTKDSKIAKSHQFGNFDFENRNI